MARSILCCLNITLVAVRRTNFRDVSEETAALNGASFEEWKEKEREMWTVSRYILKKELSKSIPDGLEVERKKRNRV